MLKKISLLVFSTLACVAMSAQSLKWYNPENAVFCVVQGQAYQGDARDGFYDRFPLRAKEDLHRRVWKLSRQTAGESIRFCTDSKNIKVRYKVKLRIAMNHMPATGVSGLDLYTYDRHGKELWLAPKYSFKDTVVYSYSDIKPMKMKGHAPNYTLFLPLYNEVEWLEIGVDEDANFGFQRPSADKPIVAYGTSICQGACASRPAMAWTNILQRRLDRPVVNLGFSGSAMHEAAVIDLLSEIDAAVYILDGMPNSFSIPAPALQDTLVKAVRQLRSKRPDTPIIMTDHCGFPHAEVYKSFYDSQEHALKCLEEAYQTLVAEGVTGLYRLRYSEIGMAAEMTVEGIHMTDYGMTAYADAYEPLIRKILNEPVGEYSTTKPVVQQRDRYNWMQRHNDILMSAPGKHYKRVLIGDSITHFWGGVEGALCQRGPDSWAELEGESLNLGCGYDRTENVLWRIYHGELDGVAADKVFLLIGTNNISCGNTDEEIAEGVRAVLHAVRARLPEADVVVVALLPRRDKEGIVRSVNKVIRAMAKQENASFINPGLKFLGRKGKIDESLFEDGLHPNASGYQLLKGYYN